MDAATKTRDLWVGTGSLILTVIFYLLFHLVFLSYSVWDTIYRMGSSAATSSSTELVSSSTRTTTTHTYIASGKDIAKMKRRLLQCCFMLCTLVNMALAIPAWTLGYPSAQPVILALKAATTTLHTYQYCPEIWK